VNSTIGIVLPVCNAEASLIGQVHDLLDVLPDLNLGFELAIVDDGSSDHTPEIAFELAREYPQVRVLRSQKSRGFESAVRAAIDQMDTDIVYVQTPGQPLRLSDLKKAITRCGERPKAAMRPVSSQLLQRLATWGQALRAARQAEELLGSVHEHTTASPVSRPLMRRSSGSGPKKMPASGGNATPAGKS